MKTLIVMLLLGLSISAKAEWYVVTKVLGYNKIQVQSAKGGSSKSTTTVRIKNLEKIEYITNDREKVFLGGSEPKRLLEQLTLGQIVWLDRLENINGENVAHLFPSYEQILKVFMRRRMTGSYTISPAVKVKLQNVSKKMISAMRNGRPPRNGAGSEDDPKMAYEHEYLKALFVYDSLEWFKKTGQFLPHSIQELYMDWLSGFMSSTGNDARDYETKIKDMQKRSGLYQDFLFEE